MNWLNSSTCCGGKAHPAAGRGAASSRVCSSALRRASRVGSVVTSPRGHQPASRLEAPSY
ncbi:hypothetical protein K438DRAFT_1840239, partial [Mycena galopus ATCC 62051]